MNDDGLNSEDIAEIINKSGLPEDLKKRLNESLPMLLENIGEAAKTVYDPNAIWMEAIQYADYVHQNLDHLSKCDDAQCNEGNLQTTLAFTREFKAMAENAMAVLDTLKIESDLVDWETVKITYRKGDDAQQ